MGRLSSNQTLSPAYLILYVTSACNMNCMHCYNWEEVQNTHSPHLPLEIIKDLFKNLRLKAVSLSGGEPLVRNDIVELCDLYACSNPEMKDLYIPTNGFQTNDIVAKVSDICRLDNICLTIGVSLDGVRETHDKIRRMSGSFEHALKTLDELIALKQRNSQLKVLVNTCVNTTNAKEIPIIADFLEQRVLELDDYAIDIVRGNPESSWVTPPEKKQFKSLMKEVEQINLHYLQKTRKSMSRNQYEANIAMKKVFIYYQYQILYKNRYMVACPVLYKYITVYNNGDVAFCELTKPIGNIKEKSITNILSSPFADDVAHEILESKCRCYHGCYVPFFISTTPFKLLRKIFMLKSICSGFITGKGS